MPGRAAMWGLLVAAAGLLPIVAPAALLNVGSIGLLRMAWAAGCRPLDLAPCGGQEAPRVLGWLQAAERWRPGAVPARQAGLYWLVAGRSDLATAALRRAATRAPAERHILAALAFAVAQQGDEAAALGLWRAAGAGPLLANHGAAALAAGRAGEALRWYRLALAVEGANPQLQLGLAEGYRLAGQTEEAIAAYEQAFALGLWAPDAAWKLGQLLASRQRYDEAVGWLEQAVARQPGNTTYLLTLADVYLAQQRDDQAGRALAQAVAVAPGQPWVRVRYGQFLATHGAPAAGLSEIQRGVALAPTSRDAWAVLGMVYQNQLHDAAGAIEAYRHVVALDPRYAWGHLALAQAYEAAGWRAEARSEYLAALAADPTSAAAQAGVQRLGPAAGGAS